MAWQDRHYYRDRSRGAGNPLMWLLTGSVPLFTVFGIRVRMHASMIIFIALTLLFAESKNGLGAKNAVVSMTILFGSVLLHEFGHCFGARYMGGDAREIVMWPLGGLAFTEPPRRWWPSFVTTAAGPGVNLLICLVTGAAIAVLNHSARAIPWFPLRDGLRTYVPHDWTTYYLWWIFLVNYALLAFNLLLVFYPFDGGRMVQEILWAFIGYYKSMRIATVIGMAGAVLVAMVALATLNLMLLLIAVFGFITCLQMRAALKAEGPWGFTEEDSLDYTSSLYDKPRKPTRSDRRAEKRTAKLEQRARAERLRIDAILDKVSRHGMHSLSWWEKRALKKATEHQRQRDLELGRSRRI